MSDTFNIAHVDDWAALYKNGRRVCEGHRISYYDLAQAGAIASLVESDGEAVEDAGGFPELLYDVKRGGSDE